MGPTHPDLSVPALLRAYSRGYFPMDEDGDLEWYNPNPRAILELGELHVSRSLRRKLNKRRFEIRADTDFEGVMRACADREETWISERMVRAYLDLHQLGCAHCLECWQGDQMVGGVYGVSLGGAFFGESMFHRVPDASKIALYHLVERLKERGFDFLEVQFLTDHLSRLGAALISKRTYLRRLAEEIRKECRFAD